MLSTLTLVADETQAIHQSKEKNQMMNENATRLLIEELQELRETPIKKCEWCHQPLPNERYHLRICPKCRKATIDAFLKGEL
jgi:hypothetical protein